MDTQNTPEIKAFDGEIANQRPNAFLPYQPNRNPNKVQERQMIGNHFIQWSDATLPLKDRSTMQLIQLWHDQAQGMNASGIVDGKSGGEAAGRSCGGGGEDG